MKRCDMCRQALELPESVSAGRCSTCRLQQEVARRYTFSADAPVPSQALMTMKAIQFECGTCGRGRAVAYEGHWPDVACAICKTRDDWCRPGDLSPYRTPENVIRPEAKTFSDGCAICVYGVGKHAMEAAPGKRCDACELKQQGKWFEAERDRWRELACAAAPALRERDATTVIADMHKIALAQIKVLREAAIAGAQASPYNPVRVKGLDGVQAAMEIAKLRAEIVSLRRQSMGLAEVQTCDTSEGWDE